MAVANLAVKLTAESSGYDKVIAKVEASTQGLGNTFDNISAQIEQAGGSAFKKLAASAAAVGTGMIAAEAAMFAVETAFKAATFAITGVAQAMASAVANTVDLGDKLFTMSQKTGVSVENLSALRYAAGQTGTSLDAMSNAVFQMQKKLGDGGSATKDTLRDLGLSLNNLRAANPADAFAQILDKLGEIPGATQRAAAGAALFGKGFKEVAQLTREDLGGLLDRAKDLGVVMSTETAVAADRFGDALADLRATVDGVAQKVGTALLPGLIAFAETIQTSFSSAVKAAGISSAGLGQLVDTMVVQIGRSAARLVEVVANMVDTLTLWASGRFLGDLALLDLLGRVEERVVHVGRAWDQVFNLGQGQARFDQLEAEAKGLQKFAASATTTILTAGSNLRKLAQATATVAAGVGENFAGTYARIQREIEESANEMRRDLGQIGDAGEAAAGKIAKAFKTIPVHIGLTQIPGTRVGVTNPRPPLPNLPVTPGVSNLPGVSVPIGTVDEIVRPFRDAFTQFGRELPNLIFGTLQHGGNLVGAIASGLAAKFSDVFQTAVDKIKKAGEGALTTGQKALGAIGAGLSSFIGGFGIGSATGSKTKGALGGAAGGALSGAAFGSVVPGIGTALGAVIGGGVGLLGGIFGGIFGGKAQDKKVQQELTQLKSALEQQFGGMEKLRTLAEKLGVNIQAAFDAKKPAQFQSAVDSLNVAIERQKTRIEGLAQAMEGVNRRAEIFATPFRSLISEREGLGENPDQGKVDGINAKLAEVAQRTQPEFDRLGVMVRDTFAGLVKESGNAFEAITQLAPAFGVLQSGVSDFGLTSTAVIDELLNTFALVNDEALGPLLQNVQSAGQVFKGLFDANALSPDGFQAISTDIGQSLQMIADKGGDMSRALALSQPVLQTLWEAQQRFGGITDQTTQSILDQAEKQGLVGASMKNVNDKILDVLIAIADVFNAKIPDALRNTQRASDKVTDDLAIQAREAARAVESSFRDIRINPIEIPFEYKTTGGLPGGIDVPAFGSGGIVTRPTLALIGERGPEAIVPLSGSGLGLRSRPSDDETRGGDVHHHYSIQAWDGRDVDRVFRDEILPRINKAVVNDTGGHRTAHEALIRMML